MEQKGSVFEPQNSLDKKASVMLAFLLHQIYPIRESIKHLGNS